jgi:hypothetical protein
VSFNCKGITNNWSYTYNLIKNHDIGFFHETWIAKWDKNVIIDIKLLNKDIYTTNASKSKGARGRASAGQVWIIPGSWKKFVTFKEISRRTSCLILNTNEIRYVLIGTYMSSDNNKEDSYTNELAVIDHTIKKYENHNTKIMLIGDFNADVYRLRFNKKKRKR